MSPQVALLDELDHICSTIYGLNEARHLYVSMILPTGEGAYHDYWIDDPDERYSRLSIFIERSRWTLHGPVADRDVDTNNNDED